MSAERFSAAAVRGLKAEPLLKTVGITLFMALFFWAYFTTLQHPRQIVTIMAAGPLDRWLPFQAWTVPLYCTLWIYVLAPPALMTEPADLFRYAAAAGLLAIAGLAVFALWPTAVVREGTGFLKSVDRGGNAFPSLHAGFALFTALRLQGLLRRLGAPGALLAGNVLWCAVIVYATLATKQHVFTDVVAGGLLGVMAAQFFNSSRLNESPSPASSAARR